MLCVYEPLLISQKLFCGNDLPFIEALTRGVCWDYEVYDDGEDLHWAAPLPLCCLCQPAQDTIVAPDLVDAVHAAAGGARDYPAEELEHWRHYDRRAYAAQRAQRRAQAFPQALVQESTAGLVSVAGLARTGEDLLKAMRVSQFRARGDLYHLPGSDRVARISDRVVH